jgi:hypothetical protein
MSKIKPVSEATETFTIPTQPPQPPTLLDVDKLALELAKAHRQTALAEAQTAQARAENAELSFRYTVLQIYRKYGLQDNDTIDPTTGTITLGAKEGQ